MFRAFLGPLARPLLSECYKFLNVYAYLKSLGGLFASSRLRFQVTNKGRDAGGSIRLVVAQLALLALNATAFTWGILRVLTAPSLVDALGTAVATAFAGFFVVVGGMAALFAWERMAASTDHAFAAQIAARISAGAVACAATVVRANAATIRAVVGGDEHAFPVGTRASVSLELQGGPLAAPGVITGVHRAPGAGPRGAQRCVLELALDPLAPATEDRLFDALCEESLPRIVDPLVRPWSPAPPAGDAVDPSPRQSLTGVYYLPVETNVL
jgi:hypothetical protein